MYDLGFDASEGFHTVSYTHLDVYKRQVLVSSAVLFTLTAALPEQKSNAAAEVIIDINKEYQTIRGFGGIDHPDVYKRQGLI